MWALHCNKSGAQAEEHCFIWPIKKTGSLRDSHFCLLCTKVGILLAQKIPFTSVVKSKCMEAGKQEESGGARQLIGIPGGKKMKPHRGNTVIFHSFQQLPRFCLRPLKGAVSAQNFLDSPGALLA